VHAAQHVVQDPGRPPVRGADRAGPSTLHTTRARRPRTRGHSQPETHTTVRPVTLSFLSLVHLYYN